MGSLYETLIVEEVEALRAIYGEEHVSFRRRQTGCVPASIAISLAPLLVDQQHPAGSKITLSALLPDGYPRDEPPKTPTLRADRLSAATCAEIVRQMMEREAPAEGEVCMFQYCNTMISILNDYAIGEDAGNNGCAGPSSTSESGDASLAGKQFEIFHGEPLTDRKSVFQAHIAVVKSMDDVDAVLRQLKQSNRKIATATHNTLAYRIAGRQGAIYQDADDDGEKGAGKCVLYVLQQVGVANVVCIVSRWFGGTKLGPVRFKHICNVARDLLEKHTSELHNSDGQ